jgi:O-methyltransferase involved in polyketide biosynthesis
MPLVVRVDEAMEEIHHRCAAQSVDEEQWVAELNALSANNVTQIIIEACLKYNVTPDEILAEMSQFTFGY